MHGRTVGRLPDRRVAQAGSHDISREDFQAGTRVLERPAGVARIDVRADVVLARALDQHDQLPRLHVAGVVFDGDFHARIERLFPTGLAHFDGVRDARFDAPGAEPVFACAEHDPEHRRTERLCHSNPQPEMFFGRAPVLFEGLRSRANTPGAKMNLQSLVGRLLAQV